MPRVLKAWLIAVLALMLLDGIWLGLLMGGTYREALGSLMLERPRWLPALGFYLLYPVGLVVFAVQPGWREGGARTARLAVLLGLVAYGTYDLSNLATLQAWPAGLSLIDMMWGALASLLSAMAAWRVTR